jgi:hypothetical protein
MLLILLRPFTTARLEVSRPVSASFAGMVRDAMGIEVSPTDATLEPRSQPDDGRPALAFSGGADSMAALAVLPDSTLPVFLRRISPAGEEVRGLYREDAAMHTIAELEQRHGITVEMVESDVEHIRGPVGFTTDWVNALPAILLADRLGIDSISWGHVAEELYNVAFERWVDWGTRLAEEGWDRVFGAAGLDFSTPVAGVSEVGTALINRGSPFGDLGESCIRGEVGAPCRNCAKCFRKSLLRNALDDRWPDDEGFERLFAIRDVWRNIDKVPMPREDVFSFIASRYRGRNGRMRLLAERLSTDEPLTWIERWYPPSAAHFPRRHAALVTRRLDRFLERMTEAEQAQFKAWNVAERVDEATAREQGAVLAELSKPAPAKPVTPPPAAPPSPPPS